MMRIRRELEIDCPSHIEHRLNQRPSPHFARAYGDSRRNHDDLNCLAALSEKLIVLIAKFEIVTEATVELPWE
jgi:hypothetical protein